MSLGDYSAWEEQIKDLEKIVEEQKRKLVVLQTENDSLRKRLEAHEAKQCYSRHDHDYLPYPEDDDR